MSTTSTNDQENDVTMGQLYEISDYSENDDNEDKEDEENSNIKDMNNQTLTPQEEAELQLENIFRNGKIIEESRYFFGYGYQGRGKEGKMIVKLTADPDNAVIYTLFGKCSTQYISVYRCSCKQVIISYVDSGRIIKCHSEERIHLCKISLFKELFFECKKNTLLYGTLQEVEEIENLTKLDFNEDGYVLVNQRDWHFNDGKNYDKRSVIIVREEDNREYGRQYFLLKADGKDKMLYRCATCDSDKKLIIFNTPCGISVVYKPSKEQHSEGCKLDDIKTLSLKYGRMIDFYDMDLWKLADITDRLLGYSKYGNLGQRLIIKHPTDDSLCYEYKRNSSKRETVKNVKYVCVTCKNAKHCAYYIKNVHGESRVLTPKFPHFSCEPKLYEKVLNEQENFQNYPTVKRNTVQKEDNQSKESEIDDERVLEWPPHKISQIMNSKVKLYNDKLCLLIHESEYGRLYKKIKNPYKDNKNRRIYQCVSCFSIVTLSLNKGKMVIRSQFIHPEDCNLISLNDNIFEGLVLDDIQPSHYGKKRKSNTMSSKTKKMIRFEEEIEDDNELEITSEISKNKQKEIIMNDEIRILNSLESQISNDTAELPNRSSVINNIQNVNELSIESINELSSNMLEKSSNKDATHQQSTSSKSTVIQKEKLNNSVIQQEKESSLSSLLSLPRIDERLANNQGIHSQRRLIRPSTEWLYNSCQLFNITQSADKAYLIWSKIKLLANPILPEAKNFKYFNSGFLLMLYLLNGEENITESLKIKNYLNKYLFKNHQNIGIIGDFNCSNLSNDDISEIIFNENTEALHFGILSKLLQCTIVIHNYSENKCLEFNFGNNSTFYIGFNNNQYFINV